MKQRVKFILNHKPVEMDVYPQQRLLDMLRDDFHLTGTKERCSAVRILYSGIYYECQGIAG